MNQHSVAWMELLEKTYLETHSLLSVVVEMALQIAWVHLVEVAEGTQMVVAGERNRLVEEAALLEAMEAHLHLVAVVEQCPAAVGLALPVEVAVRLSLEEVAVRPSLVSVHPFLELVKVETVVLVVLMVLVFEVAKVVRY